MSPSNASPAAAAAAAVAVRFLRRKGGGHPVGGVSTWLAAGFAKNEETPEIDELTAAGGDTPEEKKEAERKERDELKREQQSDQ